MLRVQQSSLSRPYCRPPAQAHRATRKTAICPGRTCWRSVSGRDAIAGGSARRCAPEGGIHYSEDDWVRIHSAGVFMAWGSGGELGSMQNVGHCLFLAAGLAWAFYTVAMKKARLDGLHAAAISAVDPWPSICQSLRSCHEVIWQPRPWATWLYRPSCRACSPQSFPCFSMAAPLTSSAHRAEPPSLLCAPR